MDMHNPKHIKNRLVYIRQHILCIKLQNRKLYNLKSNFYKYCSINSTSIYNLSSLSLRLDHSCYILVNIIHKFSFLQYIQACILYNLLWMNKKYNFLNNFSIYKLMSSKLGHFYKNYNWLMSLSMINNLNRIQHMNCLLIEGNNLAYMSCN
jgi:hypothetical protein